MSNPFLENAFTEDGSTQNGSNNNNIEPGQHIPRLFQDKKYKKMERRMFTNSLLNDANIDRNTIQNVLKNYNSTQLQNMDSYTFETEIISKSIKVDDSNINDNNNYNDSNIDIDNDPDLIHINNSIINTNNKYNNNMERINLFKMSNINNSINNNNNKLIFNQCNIIKQALNDFSLKLQIQTVLNDVISKVEHNDRLYKIKQMENRKKVQNIQYINTYINIYITYYNILIYIGIGA